ncbi:hypothetical protein JW979_09035 [bacterium]|nr:hypothetical protein [candidate division CSSED10-310 bacterium]
MDKPLLIVGKKTGAIRRLTGYYLVTKVNNESYGVRISKKNRSNRALIAKNRAHVVKIKSGDIYKGVFFGFSNEIKRILALAHVDNQTIYLLSDDFMRKEDHSRRATAISSTLPRNHDK